MSRLSARLPDLLQAAVLALVSLSILWRGGKSLDMIWVSVGVLSGVTLLSVIIARKQGKEIRIPPLMFWLLFLFFVWTIMSFVMSTSRNYGFDEVLLTGMTILACFWATHEAYVSETFEARFARVLVVTALLACGIGVLVYALQPVNRFVGTFFDYRFHTDYWPNAWAEFVLLIWPVAWWTLFSRGRKKKSQIPMGSDQQVFGHWDLVIGHFLPSLVLGLFLGSLFLSFSRGGIIAFGLQAIGFSLLLLWRLWKTIRWKRVFVSSLIIVMSAFLFFLAVNRIRSRSYETESMMRKVTLSAAEGTSSVSERTQFWRQSLKLIRAEPLLGWGPYSFRFVQPHIQTRVLETSDHAHNVLLKLGAERGIPALVLYVLFLAYAAYVGLRRAMMTKDPWASALLLAFIASIAGVLAHNMIDFNLQFVGIALPLWLMLGILVRPTGGPRGNSAFSVLSILVSTVLLVSAAAEGSHLVLSSRARRREAQGDSIAALGLYKASLRASLFPRDAWLSMSAILLGLNDLPEAETALNTGLRLNSQDGRAWRVLGDIYLRWNKREDAIRAYEKAYTYGRYNDVGITRGLVYLLLTSDRATLDNRRLEFNGLINDFATAIERNTHFIALSRNVEELVSLCDLLSRAYPDDAKSYQQVARNVQEHAREERAKYAARPRGILW